MAKLLRGHKTWLVVVNKDARDKMNDWLGPNVNPEIIIERKHYTVLDDVGYKDMAALRAIGKAAQIGWWLGKTQNSGDESMPLIDVRVIRNETNFHTLVVKP